MDRSDRDRPPLAELAERLEHGIADRGKHDGTIESGGTGGRLGTSGEHHFRGAQPFGQGEMGRVPGSRRRSRSRVGPPAEASGGPTPRIRGTRSDRPVGAAQASEPVSDQPGAQERGEPGGIGLGKP